MHDGVGACISLPLTSKAEAFLNHMSGQYEPREANTQRTHSLAESRWDPNPSFFEAA